MGELFAYTLEAGITLVSLYLAYKLMLEGKKQYMLNRFILIAIYFLSLMMPFMLSLLTFQRFGTDVVDTVVTGGPTVEFGPLTGGIIRHESSVWLRWVLWIYLAGVIASSIYFLWGVRKLAVIIRKGEKRDMGDYTLVITRDSLISPFSWRKYIVVGYEGELTGSKAIITHELAHINSLHRVDMVIAQMYAVLIWYNPVAWLMMDELKTVHEYQADDAVMCSGANIREYQLLLIKKAVGTRLPSLANNFNHSNLHKRITMMYKSKPKPAGRMGVLALIPAMAIGMAVVSIPAVASVLSEASETTLVAENTHKVTNFPRVFNKSSVPAVEKTEEIAVVEETTGEVMSADVSMPATEAVSTALPADAMPTDDVERTAPMTDTSSAEATTEEGVQQSAPQKADEDKTYVSVDKPAEFPGGIRALMTWLGNNISYPKEAKDNNLEGRVIIKFVITKEGKIRDARIIKGAAPSLDKEALRVVKAMPDWIPGEVVGKKVDSYFTLPVTFKIPKETPKTETDKTK